MGSGKEERAGRRDSLSLSLSLLSHARESTNLKERERRKEGRGGEEEEDGERIFSPLLVHARACDETRERVVGGSPRASPPNGSYFRHAEMQGERERK